MLKMRMMYGLIAVVMVLGLAQSGYSQLTISATSTPNPTANVNGFNEPTFNPNNGFGGLVVTGSVLSDAPFTGGRLRITYPSAITNACTVGTSTTGNGCATSANGPGGNLTTLAVNCLVSGTGNQCGGGVQLVLADGVFSGASIAAINAASGTVDITMPCTTQVITGVAGVWNPTNPGHIQGATGTLILTGVRIDATTAAGLPTGPAAAALSILTSSSSQGIAVSGTNVGAAPGGTGAANVPECAGNAGGGSNVQLATTSVNVITATAPGIGGLALGGIPTSVNQPSATSAAGSGITAQNTVSAGCTASPSAFYLNCGAATIYTNKNIPKASATFTVKEGFPYAWYHNDASQFNGQDLTAQATGGVTTNDAAFQLTFNNVPTGVTLTLAVAAFTGTNTNGSPAGAPTLSNTTITTANNTSNIGWGGDLSPTSTDWVTFQITNIQLSSGATLAPASITVNAQMIPNQTMALNLANGSGAVQLWGVSNDQFPVFMAAAVTGPTVVNIVPANTTFLIPFAVAAGAFDTGIAIANTSVDPFGSNGAMPQAGTVTVNLFPSTATGAGTAANFTTSATKLAGTGIAADGTVPAGATWTVNLSQLLPLATVTGGFTGYIFIQANFLPAHGAAYVYNGTGFTSSTPVLVLPPPATNGRNGLLPSVGAEILAF